MCKLGEICSFFSGGTPSSSNKDYYNGIIPFIRSGEIHSQTTELFISEEGYKNTATKMVNKGDLLMAIYGATSGDISISKIDGAINQAILCLRTKENETFIKSIWQKHVDRILLTYLQGGQGNLSAEIVKNISINVSSLKEQEKLSKFINLLDERIETQNKIIEDLKKLKSAIIESSLFPHSQKQIRLKDIGTFIRGLTYSIDDIADDTRCTGVIRATNLNYGACLNIDTDVVYVKKKPLIKQYIQNGDIIICMANGSSNLVGKNSYNPFNIDRFTVGAFCGIYRSKHPLIQWIMQSNKYKRYIYQSLQGGNGAIANINGDDILNMQFPIIDDTVAIKLKEYLNAIEEQIGINQRLHILMIKQKEYLLQQMFI